MTDVSRPDWLEWPQVRQVMDIFNAAGVPVCFIGGCMRDAFIGKPPADFDLLAASPIEVTKDILRQAGIESFTPDMEIRIEKAVVGGHQFDFFHSEGSHKMQPFEKRAELCVKRFDFTLNTLCLFSPGELRDPFGGLADLAAGKVRFLPGVDARKNPCCVVRFFRFHAWFGKGDPDRESLETCITHAPRLASIPRWFLQSNVRKLLLTPKVTASLQLMNQHGILKYAIGFSPVSLELLEALAHIENILGEPASWQRKIILLLLAAPFSPEKALQHLTNFWDADEHTQKELATLLEYMIAADADMTAETRTALITQLGRETVRNLLLIRWALENDAEGAKEKYLAAIAAVN